MALTMDEKNKLTSSGKVKDYVGKTWDEIEKIMSSGSSEGKRIGNEVNNIRTGGKEKPPTAYTPPPVDRWSLIANNQRGNSNMITDASGRKMTIMQRAIDENGIEAYIDENGNFIDRSNDSDDSSSGGSYYSGGSNNPITGNIESEIERLSRLQKEQAIANLDKSKASALSNLGAEKTTIAPKYYDARNQVSTTSQMGAKSFAEYMANRGLISSGENAQAEISRNVALQGTMGNINTGEANAFADISRRETDINNAYLNDKTNAEAGIEASKLQSLIDEMRRQENLALQQDQLDYNRDYQTNRDTVNDNRYDMEYQDTQNTNKTELEKVQLEQAKKDFLNTITRFANNYQSEINKVKNDGDSSNDWQIPYLESARQEKIQTEGLDQNGNKLPNNTQTSFEQALALWKSYGVATQDIAGILGVPVGAKTTDYQQMQYSTGKPYFAPKTSGGSKTDPLAGYFK